MIQYHVFVPSLDPELCLSCWDIRVNHADQPVKPQREPEPVAVARRTDPDTSWEAAKSVRDIRETQQAVLAALRAHGPMTDEEIAERIRSERKQSPSGLRTRRSELVDLHMVTYAGYKRPTKSGRKSRVWKAA